jgi:hypothetical protein
MWPLTVREKDELTMFEKKIQTIFRSQMSRRTEKIIV